MSDKPLTLEQANALAPELLDAFFGMSRSTIYKTPARPTRKPRPEPKTTDMFSPARVAARLGVDTHKIIAWINSGELQAVNLALKRQGGRPRWKIYLDDLLAFERARRNGVQELPATRRSSRRRTVKEFI